MSAVLLVLGWAWNPHSGFSGLGLVLSRYVLSVGLPFEQWLQALTESRAARGGSRKRFSPTPAPACHRLPWVTGGEWRAGDERTVGSARRGSAATRSTMAALVLTLYSRRNLGPGAGVALQLAGADPGASSTLAKLRSRQALKQLSYLQAVHETGARLTHDVKNLLQSLNALCSAAPNAKATRSRRSSTSLLRRQLPAISRAPAADPGQAAAAGAAGAAARRRRRAGGATWSGSSSTIAIRLFRHRHARRGPWCRRAFSTASLDNLIENALRKAGGRAGPGRQRDPRHDRRRRPLGLRRRARRFPRRSRSDLFPGAGALGIRTGNRPLSGGAAGGVVRLPAAGWRRIDPGQVCFRLEKQGRTATE